MLVLTRKAGESVRIGDDIEVVITSVEHNKVKIGIRSPRHIPIYREELYQKILEENRDAVSMDLSDMDLLLDLFTPKGAENTGRKPLLVADKLSDDSEDYTR